MNDPSQQLPQSGASGRRDSATTSDLQFEQYEPAPSEHATDGAPVAATACAACQQPITDAYYEAGGKVFCPRCREQYQAEQSGGSRMGRMLRAVVFGIVAGIGGTIIWFGVRKLTGYEVGLIAVVVGLMVGGAVRAGSRGRGGAFYQLLAVFITYSSIAANYVPDVFQAMRDEWKREDVAAVHNATPATQSSTQPTIEALEKPVADATEATAAAPTPIEDEPVGAGRAIVALLLVGTIAFVFALALPVLAGFSNIIGLLIIGFAIWEAWKMNKRTVVTFTGPYALAGGAAPPPIPGAGLA